MKLPKITSEFLQYVEEIETPAIIYNFEILDFIIEKIKKDTINIHNLELCFSMKANRNKEVLKHLSSKGLSVDVASKQEFYIAKSIGFKKIYSTSAGMNYDVIAKMYNDDILFDFNSISQIEKFIEQYNFKEIGIRCKIFFRNSYNFISLDSRFGIELDYNFENFIKENNLKITQLHCHIGEKRNIHVCSEMLEFLKEKLDSDILQDVVNLNIGGGFTALYQEESQVKEFWNMLERFTWYFKDKGRDLRIIIEPGMLITLLSGFLKTRVLDVNRNRNDEIDLVLDSSAFNLLTWCKAKPLYCSYNKMGTEMKIHNLYGPTCYEEDIYLKGYRKNELKIGDSIIFYPVGAYVSSMSKNLHAIPSPTEYIYRKVMTR